MTNTLITSDDLKDLNTEEMDSTDIAWEQLHTHPPEEVLERYGMCRLTEAECEQIEEHILFCKPCRVYRDDAYFRRSVRLPRIPLSETP